MHIHGEMCIRVNKTSPFSIVMTVAQFVSRLQRAEHVSKMCDTKREKKRRCEKCPISVSWLTHQLCEHLAGEQKLSVRTRMSLCSTRGLGFVLLFLETV